MPYQKLISLIVLCFSILAGCSSNQEETGTVETKVATEEQVNTPCNIIELEYEKIERVIEDSNFRQTPFTIFKTDDLEIRTMSFGGWDNFYKIVSKNSSSDWMEFDLEVEYSKDYEHLYVSRIYKNTETESYYFTHFGHTEELDILIVDEIVEGEIISTYNAYPNQESFNLIMNGQYNNLFRQKKFIACSSDSVGLKIITVLDSNFSLRYLNITKESKEEFLKYHSLQPGMIRLLDSLDQILADQKPKYNYTLKKCFWENEPVSCTFNIQSKNISYSKDSSLNGDNIYFIGDTLRIRSTYYDSPGQDSEDETTTLYDFVFSEKYQELVLDKAERLENYVVVKANGNYAMMSPSYSKAVATRIPYNRLTFTHFAKLFEDNLQGYPLDLDKYVGE